MKSNDKLTILVERLVAAAVALGNVALFVVHMAGPVAVVLGSRMEVLSGDAFPRSPAFMVAGLVAIVLMLVFITSLWMSFARGGRWRWVLMACLVILMLVHLSGAVAGQMQLGLAYVVVRSYISSALFCAWIALNAIYWWHLRPKAGLLKLVTGPLGQAFKVDVRGHGASRFLYVLGAGRAAEVSCNNGAYSVEFWESLDADAQPVGEAVLPSVERVEEALLARLQPSRRERGSDEGA